MSFGVYLQNKRVEAGLSQGDVAKILGWATSQMVSNFERDISMPPVDSIDILASAYKLKSKDLRKMYYERKIEIICNEWKKKLGL